MSLSWNGIRTVTDLELRQRIRSKRWIFALIAWFLFIGLITGIIIWSIYKSWDSDGCELWDSYCAPPAGPIAFSVIVIFVLGMGLVIAPAFTATSINGDRSAGTLATLQATRLSALEIATGKLIAAWLTAGVFLVVTLPFAILSMVLGGISVWQVAVCFLVTFILVGIMCAIGLGWSAIMSRAALSTVMTYLCTVFLTFITPLLVLFSIPFVEDTHTIQIWGVSDQVRYQYYDDVNDFWHENDGDEVDYSQAPVPPVDQCHWYSNEVTTTRIDYVWWMLMPNPFVIVADASPLPPAAKGDLSTYSDDLLSGIRYLVRETAQAPQPERDECLNLYYNAPQYYVQTDNNNDIVEIRNLDGTKVSNYDTPVKEKLVTAQNPIWPWGLGFDLLLGGLFFFVAVRKLTIPYKTLAQGTRVA